MKAGANYPISDTSKEDRLIRLQHNLERGNHLVQEENLVRKIDKFIQNELNYSLLLPILKVKIPKILGAEAYPIYIMKQITIDNKG